MVEPSSVYYECLLLHGEKGFLWLLGPLIIANNEQLLPSRGVACRRLWDM
jgi:hypothetical protein